MTGFPVIPYGITSEINVIGTEDITCQDPIQDQTPYVYGASGGYVDNNVLICGGNDTNMCMSMFELHNPISMKYIRTFSSSIVIKNKVST